MNTNCVGQIQDHVINRECAGGYLQIELVLLYKRFRYRLVVLWSLSDDVELLLGELPHMLLCTWTYDGDSPLVMWSANTHQMLRIDVILEYAVELIITL